MLISPPFLPPRAAQQSEAAWLDQAMLVPQQNYIPVRGDLSVAGAYPISQEFAWHGGQHLIAPVAENIGLTVRAIADGTVVYVRRPRIVARPQASENMSLPADPLLYGRQDFCPTNDGTVLIRHSTEIGANVGAPVRVTYYSLYNHLDRIADSVVQGQPIYRKDEIGAAGYIYGNAWQIHMEILCDDANLRHLVGRNSGELPLTADGRSDVIYGEIYIHLPAETPAYGESPVPQNPVAHKQPPRPNKNAAWPELVPLMAAHNTKEGLIVGIRYGMGDGEQGGNATVTTYRLNGAKIGQAFVEQDAEYNLYTKANEIAKAYPENAKPAPSAVYELLRFGRVIGPDPMTPANVPHWRKIRTPSGEGWVNLNAANTHKFSDADFPHWKGWNLIDAGNTLDSRCDNTKIMGWFDANKDGKVTQDERTAGQQNIAAQEMMKRAICKFPSEWSESTIDQRWGWLKTQGEDNPNPLGDEDYALLKAHAKSLAFWEKARASDSNLPEIPWRFQPRAFIEHFRRCGWLSLDECAQLLPRKGVKDCVAKWNSAKDRWRDIGYINLNKVFRRYALLSANRQTAFLAQVYIETGCLALLKEGGEGKSNPKLPMTQYYAAFYGRGLMQLTWAGTYADYGKFRGLANHTGTYVDNRITTTSTHDWAAPSEDKKGNQVRDQRQWAPRFDPDIVASNTYHASDSGAFFWVQKHFTGTSNINRLADQGVASELVGRMSILVNGGGNGYNERLQYAAFIERYRGDGTEAAQTGMITATRQGISHGQWVTKGDTFTLNINYTPQRP